MQDVALGVLDRNMMMTVPNFMVHFRPSDSGDLELEGFGEATEDAIFTRAYPLLDKALLDATRDDETSSPTPEGMALIQAAVSGRAGVVGNPLFGALDRRY
jgi:hypothetical protein